MFHYRHASTPRHARRLLAIVAALSVVGGGIAYAISSPPVIGLMVSSHADHSSPFRLAHSALVEDSYVFLAGESSTQITSVKYYLDDGVATTAPAGSSSAAPFDMGKLDLTTLDPGRHTILAVLTLPNGVERDLFARFTTAVPTPTATTPTVTTPAVTTPAVTTPAATPTACGGEVPTKADGSPWQCSWSDEFDGSTLSSAWSVIPYGLGSSCLYNDPNYVQVANGNLSLLAKRLPATDDCTKQWQLNYGGGGIQTQGQFAQQYGRFEVKAKFPAGDGFWPAIWLLPDDNTYNGEIDVLESYGGRGPNGDATLHAPAGGPGPQKKCDISPDYSSDFHTYTLEWKQGEIKISYDNVVCADFTKMDDGSPLPTSFDKPYHVLLNLAIQPWIPPTAATVFPAAMQVDYVRVWK